MIEKYIQIRKEYFKMVKYRIRHCYLPFFSSTVGVLSSEVRCHNLWRNAITHIIHVYTYMCSFLLLFLLFFSLLVVRFTSSCVVVSTSWAGLFLRLFSGSTMKARAGCARDRS